MGPELIDIGSRMTPLVGYPTPLVGCPAVFGRSAVVGRGSFVGRASLVVRCRCPWFRAPGTVVGEQFMTDCSLLINDQRQRTGTPSYDLVSVRRGTAWTWPPWPPDCVKLYGLTIVSPSVMSHGVLYSVGARCSPASAARRYFTAGTGERCRTGRIDACRRWPFDVRRVHSHRRTKG